MTEHDDTIHGELKRLAEAQERTATALEDISKALGGTDGWRIGAALGVIASSLEEIAGTDHKNG